MLTSRPGDCGSVDVDVSIVIVLQLRSSEEFNIIYNNTSIDTPMDSYSCNYLHCLAVIYGLPLLHIPHSKTQLVASIGAIHT